jgi:hypothetical protein
MAERPFNKLPRAGKGETMNFKLAASAALILAATVGFAAPDAFDKYAANIGILQLKEVQAELKVSQAQRDKLNKHAKWVEAEQKKIRDKVDPKKGPTQADQKKVATILNQFKDKIVAELSAVQLKRLRELSLQQMGHTALLDDTVSKKVGITADQLGKLRKSYEAMMDKVTKAQAAAYKPINDKYAKKTPKTDAEKKKVGDAYIAEIKAADAKLKPTLQKYAAEYKTKLDASLTAAQKKSWSALQGKPFVIKPK